MTVEEFYTEAGGSYAQACARLVQDRLIVKFLGKFLEDQSYSALIKAIDTGDLEQAFRSAHTLKGLCMNLELGKLGKPVSEITEMLRNECNWSGNDEDGHKKTADPGAGQFDEYMEQAAFAYEETVKAIRELMKSQPQ